MDPLNKQERTEAFIKMLAFFLLAVIVVSIPMYYAFKMPEKENNFYKTAFEKLYTQEENESILEKEFLYVTDSAISLFNSYRLEEDELTRDKIQLRYSDATNRMEDYLSKISDDTVKVELYDNIIFAYNNLFSSWAEKNELQAQLDECMKMNQSKSAEISEKTKIVKKENEKSIQQKEIDLINKALDKHDGSKRLAAKELGTTERKLKKRMKELGIG